MNKNTDKKPRFEIANEVYKEKHPLPYPDSNKQKTGQEKTKTNTKQGNSSNTQPKTTQTTTKK